MAESKERPADQQWAKAQDARRTDFDRAKSPMPMRVAAFALWVVAIALEVAWILVVSGALYVPVLSDMVWLSVVIGVVGCLVLTLFGRRSIAGCDWCRDGFGGMCPVGPVLLRLKEPSCVKQSRRNRCSSRCHCCGRIGRQRPITGVLHRSELSLWRVRGDADWSCPDEPGAPATVCLVPISLCQMACRLAIEQLHRVKSPAVGIHVPA